MIKLKNYLRDKNEIRIEINNSTNIEQVTKFRKERNQILKQIREIQIEIRNRNIDKVVKQIDEAQNDRKMYTAIKMLNRSERKENNFMHDKQGKSITNQNEINKLIKEHFNQNLYDSNIAEIQSFRGQPRPLNMPITEKEVKNISQQNKQQ